MNESKSIATTQRLKGKARAYWHILWGLLVLAWASSHSEKVKKLDKGWKKSDKAWCHGRHVRIRINIGWVPL